MRLSKIFPSKKTSRRRNALSQRVKPRRGQFERLERRDLLALAVTTADYQALVEAGSTDGSEGSAIWVTSLADTTNANDGKITLREALDYAGQSLTSGETVASVVRFSVGGTITLSSASQSLKILGKNVTVDAGDVGGVTVTSASSLLLYVYGGAEISPISVSLKNMTFTGGKTGSGAKGSAVQLSQYCNLTATQCVFSNNASTSNTGAALYVDSGSLTLLDSIVSGNSATGSSSQGGGVYVNSGSLNAERTAFVGNSAKEGGAVYSKGGVVNLNGCTFRSNRATEGDGGALYSSAAAVNANNVGFADNESAEFGGAVYVSGEVDSSFTDVKFSKNVAQNGGAVYQDSESLTINNAEFIGNRASQNGGAFYLCLNASSLVSNGVFDSNDAQQNGGAVYNEGSFFLLGGAFDSNVSKNNGGALWSSYYFEIRDAEFSQNSTSLYGGSIYSQSNATSWLLRSQIENSSANEGAGLYNNGSVSIIDSGFLGNVATVNGGACSNLGTLNVFSTTISRNEALGANGAGGGVLNYPNASLSVVDSTLSANSAPYGSGGAVANNGVVAVSGSAVDSNTAGEFGGGIYNGGDLTVDYSTLSNNEANNGGALASVYGSSASFVGSTLWNNVAQNNGGGAYIYGSTKFQSSILCYNSAATSSVAAYYYSPDATSAPSFDSASSLFANIANSEREQKNGNENVVFIDPETYETIDFNAYFGALAVLGSAVQKSILIRNVGQNDLQFSQLTSLSNADVSSIFSFDLYSSTNKSLDSSNFTIGANDYARLCFNVDPQKIGSQVIDLSWTTKELDAEGNAVANSEKSVSLTGTTEVAKSGSITAKVSTLSDDASANVSVDEAGAISISLSRAPTSNFILYLRPSENAYLWKESNEGVQDADVLVFNASNYNVAQTVRVSLKEDYLLDNGSYDNVVSVELQLSSLEDAWKGSTFNPLELKIANYIPFVGSSSIDLNKYSTSGSTRWDLNGDGVVDATTVGSSVWIDSSQVDSDHISAYTTRNGVTTETRYDAVIVPALPTVEGVVTASASTPGFARVELIAKENPVARWRVDWGDCSQISVLDELSYAQTFSHFYAKDGKYAISAELVDSDGRGTGRWYHLGTVSISGASQSSGAIIDAFSELQESLDVFFDEVDLDDIAKGFLDGTDASETFYGPVFDVAQLSNKRNRSNFFDVDDLD